MNPRLGKQLGQGFIQSQYGGGGGGGAEGLEQVFPSLAHQGGDSGWSCSEDAGVCINYCSASQTPICI